MKLEKRVYEKKSKNDEINVANVWKRWQKKYFLAEAMNSNDATSLQNEIYKHTFIFHLLFWQIFHDNLFYILNAKLSTTFEYVHSV